MAEVMTCNFHDRVTKDSSASKLAFLSDHMLMGKASCHVSLRRDPHGKTLRPPDKTTQVNLDADSSAQVKPSDDCSPRCRLDCDLMRDPEPELYG